MKKLFKSTLSIVLSLALTVMCLTCAFSGLTASADAVTTPEKMIEITPQVAGDAVSFRQQTLTQGHTYKLKMLQNGITSVIPFSTDWSTYTNTPAVSGTEGDYSTYTFTCVYPRTRFLFTTESAGTSGYMADITLYDITNSTDTGIDFTAMTFVYSANTYSNWLVDRPDVPTYSSDILNADIANINFVALLDYDATVFETPEEPGEPEAPVYPEKMFRITGAGTNDCVLFWSNALTTGHTYEIKMLQTGVQAVRVLVSNNWANYPNYATTVSTDGQYTIYTFTIPSNVTPSNSKVLIYPGTAGAEAYVADISIKDTTSGTVVKQVATDGTEAWRQGNLLDNYWVANDLAEGRVTLLDFDTESLGIIEEPETPDDMFRINNGYNGGAVAFNVGTVSLGHTFEVSMLQSGVDKVSVMSTDWATYTRTDAAVSTRENYTIYTFTPTYAWLQVYISAGAADSVAFVSDIKVKDITTNTLVMSVDGETAWKSAMVTGNPQLFSDAAPSNRLALMDYDAVALGDIESEKPAEEPVKAIQIKAPTYSGGDENPAAVMTRTSALTAGHTYRLEMYKQGILSVRYNEYTNSVWTAHTISGISDDDGFSVYYFVPTQSYAEIRLSVGGSGKLSYISGIKLYDLADTEKTNLLNDPTESGNFNNWGAHMLASNQMGTVDAAILHNSTAVRMNKVGSASLIYFDEKCFFDLGDYNGDGALDVRDLVSLKKYAANYEVTLNDKAFVDDNSVLANELIYSVKLLLGFTYADFEILVNAPAASMQYSGGAETETIALKKSIYKAADDLTITGTTYYVSANGSVEGAGTITNPISADAVNDLSLSSGDAVLFKRGDTFRLSEPIYMVSGVTYGAYGEGKKPELYGSSKNYAKAQWYNKTGNIWQTDLTADDVGVMVFNGGDSVGVKQDMEARLTTTGDYMNDTVWHVLYLYCEGNPSQVYDSIELATTESALYGHAVSNVKVDNLSIKYTGAHAVDFHADYASNQTSNVTVSNCEIGWGGGFWFPTNGGGHGEQYGNGIEFYGPAQHIDVNNCYVYQQFDAGLTFQENGYVDYYDIAFDSNIVEYCAYNIEFFNGGAEGVLNHLNEGYYRNIEITDNILRFAGYGYGSNRPHAHGVANITCWDETFTKSHASFTITGNIFDCSANNLIYWPNSSSTANITASGNKFYQQANPIDYTLLYHVDQSAPGYTANASLHIGTQQSVTGNTKSERQSSFTTQMRTFESGTSNAFWLEAE